MNRAERREDARFLNTGDRARHQVELRDLLEAEFAAHDAPHWLDAFRGAGVPCAPINTYSQVLADTQLEHMGWVQPLTLPNGVQTRTFASPIRVNGRNLPVRSAPPALGEHTEELTAALRVTR
ncbi:lipid metabolism-like protein [Caballeronia ptereochthonis]|uniref:Lipid metabolism-like protein n=2 Tax=Caballeronia ptereochthonis TaxID=1777144 RepID=A0A158AXU4_9BURK|nr:lipid metabolism-like protein [Caballeronia ptereochthonis]